QHASVLTDGQAPGGGKAVDLALDVEQRIDAPDRLQRDRRDVRRRSSTPGILRDVGELEELPAGMAPADGMRDPLRPAPWNIERVEATISVRLQDAGEVLQVPCRMLAPAVARGIVEGGWRGDPTERPVVPDIGPDAAGDRLALGQDRHRRVVSVQS